MGAYSTVWAYLDSKTVDMKLYLITFSDKEVIAILPISAGQILGCSQCIIASIEYAKLMLQAIGISVKKLDEYVEPVAFDE